MTTVQLSIPKFQQTQRSKLNLNNNSSIQKFKIQPKPIAVGSTCQVFLAINPQTRQSCAIKKLSAKYNLKTSCDQGEIQQFPAEFIEQIQILKNLNHPNIIQLKESIVQNQHQGQKSFHMVFQYLPFDLRKLIKSKVHLSEVEIKKILFQILCALKHMSEKGIMHRDIKPENILISQDLETVKVCDFGLAHQQKKEKSDSDSNKAKQPSLSHHVVTRYYRPPEVILLAKKYDSKVDVWSVGCIFGELLQMLQQNSPNFKRVPLFTGKGCFPISPPKNKQSTDYQLKNGFAHSQNDQLSKILDVIGSSPKNQTFLNPETDSKSIKYLNSFDQYQRTPLTHLFQRLSPQAQNLLQNLLKFNPNERLSAEQAMSHPYFNKVRKLYSKNYQKRYEQIEEFKNMINKPIGKLSTK